MPLGRALLVALFVQNSMGTAPDGAPTRARLEVRADADCLSRGDLQSRVAVRSNRIQFVDDASISARVSLRSSRPGNVVAELLFVSNGAEQAPRRFNARSCQEAADAIALIIAVTLDPTLKPQAATMDRRDQKNGGTDKPVGTPAAPSAPNAADSNPATARDRPTDTSPPPTSAPMPVPLPSAPKPSTSKHQYAAYLAGQATFGPAPGVMPGLALYGMAASDREGPWAPTLFIGASHVWRSEFSELGGTASFTLDAASLDACPLRLRWARLDARPCASVLGGRMTSRGMDTDDPGGESRRFASIGAALVAAVQLGGPLELSVRLGVGGTLTRDGYRFGQNVFYRANAITASASVGLGVRWP